MLRQEAEGQDHALADGDAAAALDGARASEVSVLNALSADSVVDRTAPMANDSDVQNIDSPLLSAPPVAASPAETPSASDESALGRTIAETVTDEVFSVLFDVRQANKDETAFLSAADVTARYRSAEE